MSPGEHPAEPVLVVSIDGLAPRHITRTTMPNLTTLARSGGSCFRARTVTPPLTLPVHTSMFRGVTPADHGLVDNTALPVQTEAPSFLRVARGAGRSTALFLNWRPLDTVIEPDAAELRYAVDGGYDPEDDRRSVDAALAAIDEGHHDLTVVYLSRPDVDGHEHGWDSPAYRAAATRSDAELGRLLEAVGPTASVLVTTDHGGVGTGHADPVPEVLDTFVVVRAPGRVAPATGWAMSGPLDVAPTVADLCRVAPDPRWQGLSLLGREEPLVEAVLALLRTAADQSYGERVSLLDHSLQSAALARAEGAGEEMVLACLLHDLGHLLGRAGQWGLPDHAEVGARALQPLLAPAVVEPIRGHVEAKRYRVTVDPDYHAQLSEASQMTLAQQGGRLSPEAVERFEADPFRTEALRLRGYDDEGKVEGLAIPPLDSYRSLLTAALAPEPPIDPSWARDACRCPTCRDPANGQHLIDATDLDGWTVVRTDRSDDELLVTLHHRTGERHRCHIPIDPPADLPVERWPGGGAGWLRATASNRGDGTADFVDQLATRGVALLSGCGTEPGTVLGVAAEIGFVRETNYGALFDVVAEPDPINLAYTPLGLPAHTDNAYRVPCPTVQLLHCLVAAAEGGASRLVDGLAAAEQLRTDHRDQFDTLASTEVTFRYHAGGVDLRAKRPLIELDGEGAVRAISVNNRSMEPLAAGRTDAGRFYRAYRQLVDLLDDDRHAVEFVLRPGELVAFDNRRVLHGRRAFPVTERRHLQGCYVDIDAIHSTARLARLTGR